jgi:hypothetical protein
MDHRVKPGGDEEEKGPEDAHRGILQAGKRDSLNSSSPKFAVDCNRRRFGPKEKEQ